MHNEKFIAPFIAFIKEHFDFEEHFFILVGGASPEIIKLPSYENVLYLDNSYDSKWNYFKCSKLLKQYTTNADKIILHSLFSNYKNLFLFFNKDLLIKCYWMIWGGDLYKYKFAKRNLKFKILEFLRKVVIKNIYCITTTVPGDYKLAQDWYGTNAIYIENLMYPSHIYRKIPRIDTSKTKDNTIHIQIGNSADLTNNHVEILHKLLKYKNKDIKIYVPLSYGDQIYAEKVIIIGKELFEDKFIPMMNFMTFNEYNNYMSSIDIAIFNHDRQQAMGNIIGLLSLGKKVYLKSSVTPYPYFQNLGLKIFDSKQEISIDKIDKESSAKNIDITTSFFSYKTLIKNWQGIFNG